MAGPLSDPDKARCGVIVLARHGEPDLSRKVRLTAEEYRTFWATYEGVGLKAIQAPPAELRTWAETSGALVASTRPRAIESIRLICSGRNFRTEEMLIEAPLPPPKFPRWVRLSPSVWGFLARFWWWYFNHHEGEETRAAAEARAEAAATLLESLAKGDSHVLVLAHGFFNYLIGRALRRRGWRLARSEGFRYWSMRRFERP